jgi:nucleoside phosphorylase
MGVELAPVEAMLDEMHPSLPSSRDENSYTLGRIGVHNVVIAVMPEIGNNNAALVAKQLMNDFRSIRFSLLVGIRGGIPDGEKIDIRLGDIVVSKPTDTFGGVVQFDRGKAGASGRFERTGILQKPPKMLMATVEKLGAKHRKTGSDIPTFLSEMLLKFPKMREQYIRMAKMTSCSRLHIVITTATIVRIRTQILYVNIMAMRAVEDATLIK